MINLEKQVMNDVNHQENYNKIQRAINQGIPNIYFIQVNAQNTGEQILQTRINITNALSLSSDITVINVNNNIIRIRVNKTGTTSVIVATNSLSRILSLNAEYE